VSLGVAEALLNPTVAQMAKLIDGRQQRSRRESAVVELRSGAAELPVYFVYASPDEFRVAKATSGRHPVFGIEVPWPRSWHHAVVANQRSGFPTMAQVVAPFVAALTAHAGARPCVLAGHSFGGLLAYEAAREVMRRGGKVELVVLLDTWARPPDVHKIAWHDLWQQWAELDLGSPARLAQSLAARLRGSWRTTRWLLGQHKARVQSILQRRPPNLGLPSTVLDEDGMPVPEALVRRAYAEIARSYEPRPLDCRGVLFRTDPEQSLMMRACDDSNGWRGLFARGLEIVPIVGDHITMVRQHQQEVARSLDEVLQRHWPLPGTNGNGEPFGG
jgi:thioesterase domain-containing protein